jgi:hypothetical protein
VLVLVGAARLFVAIMCDMTHIQKEGRMSKGKDKKPKADKSKPKTGVSPYKAAQGTGKPAVSAFAKKPGR